MHKKIFQVISVLLIAAFVLAGCQAGSGNKVGGQVNYLGWEGYDDPEVFKDFNAENKIVVNSTYIGSNDELITKFKAGGPGVYDIGNLNSRYLNVMIQQGMLQPWDESKLPALSEFYPAWKDTNFGRGPDGKLYAVPGFVGYTEVCYRTDMVPEPQDWNYWQQAPWSEKYAVTTNPLASFYIWAMPLGKGQDATKWTKQDLEDLKAYGLAKWKGATTTSSSEGERSDLLIRGVVSSADDTWEMVAINAKKAGVDVKCKLPPGPVKVWVDAFVLFKGAPNPEAAHTWMNYAVSKDTMARLMTKLGIAVGNQQACNMADADLKKLSGCEGMNDVLMHAEFNILPDSEPKEGYVSLDDLYKAFDEIKLESGK
jgi:spermidine/putrescine transport system substrate-binding protein